MFAQDTHDNVQMLSDDKVDMEINWNINLRAWNQRPLTEGRMKKKEWWVSRQEGEDYKRYIIWQKVMAMLHSNTQLKKERNVDTVEWCQKPAAQQKTKEEEDTVTSAVKRICLTINM